MQEKDMVLDILSGTKASLGNYAKVIAETSDQNLRRTFQQMRDSDEKFQYDLYKVAEQKGYYATSPSSSPQDINSVKSSLSSGAQQGTVPTGILQGMK
ncbi:MAG: spore coat protein [Clostridiales bacterium]|jgi:spore coat protein CotF|nr:spore coat protein [Clostridiales bacterium]